MTRFEEDGAKLREAFGCDPGQALPDGRQWLRDPIDKYVACPQCKATGMLTETARCAFCDGAGVVELAPLIADRDRLRESLGEIWDDLRDINLTTAAGWAAVAHARQVAESSNRG